MAKVICKLPNASERINGVEFVSHKLGMISAEIEDDVAERFCRIKGYVLADKKGREVVPEAAGDPAPTPAGGSVPPVGGQPPSGSNQAPAPGAE